AHIEGGAVGRVEHGRNAPAPRALAVLKGKVVFAAADSRVVVLGFAVDKATEFALGHEFAGENGGPAEIGRFGAHVREAGALFELDQFGRFIEMHNGGTSADDVLA